MTAETDQPTTPAPGSLGPCKHHPDPEIDFEVECDVLEGMAFDVTHGMRSQWPFWNRLSRAYRVGREDGHFARLPALRDHLNRLQADVHANAAGHTMNAPHGGAEAYDHL